jgi:hypothetical protein
VTRRGIREMKHKRILFGDLQHTPYQNPYFPQGIRKMSEVWVDPSGDGYVSMVPGYSLLDDLDGVASNVVIVSADEVGAVTSNGSRSVAPVFFMFDNAGTEAYVYRMSYFGVVDDASNLIYTFTTIPTTGNETLGGRLPWYSFDGDVALYTSGDGSGLLGIKYSVDDYTGETLGIDRPNVITGDDTGAAATSATGAGGGTAVKGVVKYFVSYAGQDGTEEGALSLEFGEFDAGDGDDVLLSNLPTLSTNKRRLYRTFKDGDQPFYLATLNSSDTTYTDNIADADLGDLPLKMGDPPDERYGILSAVWHYGRAYILTEPKSGGRVYFTDPEEIESFYTSEFGNWFVVDDSYEKRALARIPAGLLLFGQHSSYLLRGRTPADFTLVELSPVGGEFPSYGCASNGAVCQTPSGVYFFSISNYAVVQVSPDGQSREISKPIENDLRDTIGEPVAATPGGYEDTSYSVRLRWWGKYNLLIVSKKSVVGNSTEKTWLYDIERGAWIGSFNWSFETMCNWKGVNGYFSLVGSRDNDQNIYQFLTGTDHNGTAISSPTVGAPTFTGDDPTVEKTFHYVDLLMKGEASKSVTVNWFIDGATTADGTATVTLTGTDSRERHRVYINERGREIDIDTVLDNSSVSHGIYGIIYGYTDDTSVVQS